MIRRSYIYENERYGIVVGEPLLREVAEHLKNSAPFCYHVINKQHDVLELETTVLVRAMSEADDLNDALIEYEANKNMTIPTSVGDVTVN